MGFSIRKHTILLVLGGSRAYGTHTPSSDIDVKGVAIAPASYILGCHKSFDQQQAPEQIAQFTDLFSPKEQAIIAREKLEGVVYGLQKFMRLATECNPNILDALFCREQEVRLCTKSGRSLRDARDLFLSAKARHTFAGYASAQLKRIRSHRKWLLDPPLKKPERGDYNLFKGIEQKQLEAARAAIEKVMDSWELDLSRLEKSERIPLLEKIKETFATMTVASDTRFASAARTLGYNENFIEILERNRRYRRDLEDYKQFKRWEKNRNPKRAALEKRHGYDTKHAAHLVRLLRMAREVLEDNTLHVWRGDKDAQELLEIRAGAWSYDKLISWSEKENEAQKALFEKKKFSVKNAPNKEAINTLCMTLIEQALQNKGA